MTGSISSTIKITSMYCTKSKFTKYKPTKVSSMKEQYFLFYNTNGFNSCNRILTAVKVSNKEESIIPKDPQKVINY